MALSNAERQRRFKERKRAKGLTQKVVWTDRDGFSCPPNASGERPRITRNKFTRDFNKLMESMDEVSTEEIYAELLVITKQLKVKYDKTMAAVDKAVEEEKKAGRWQ